MGLESRCTLRLGRRSYEGKALLETGSLLFRGADTRLEVPFRTIAQVDASNGVLRVTHADGVACSSSAPPRRAGRRGFGIRARSSINSA